jgi:hypothetical protein
MWLLFIYIFLIAYLFSPGVLMPIPRKYRLRHVAAVHALVISLILVFTMNAAVRHMSRII